MGADLLLAEAAPLQFHDRPLQLAVALPLQHRRRQVPIGGLRQRRGDLAAGPLVLLVFQLPGKLVADRVAQLGLVLETAQLFQQLGRQLGASPAS